MTSVYPSDADYRPDIDGLRAVAVLAVIGFHAGVPGFGGGYVGVDIFFVISGFVITRLIQRELQAGRFNLWRFYERRFRRLMPALVVVLLACLLPAWWWMLPEQLAGFSTSVAAVLLMVPNVFFWRQTGYFDAAAESHALLHTWSLGIEEQFYIVFSLFLVLVWRVARSRLRWLLSGLFFGSLLLCEIASRQPGVSAFYLLPFRAWELLAGALAAQWPRQAAPQIGAARATLAGALPWLGAAGLLASIVGFSARTPFPSVWTLAPVVGAVLLLRGAALHVVNRLLACKPLVAIGLISYSAYLWHYPVFVFAKLALLREPTWLATLGLVGGTLGVAALCWRHVEQPARRSDLRFTHVAAWVGLGLAVVLLFGWSSWSSGGAPSRLPVQARQLLAQGAEKNPRQHECLTTRENARSADQGCLLGVPGVEATVALIGDSHADALFVALDKRLRRAGLGAQFMAHGGCPPVPGVYRSDMRDPAHCNRFFHALYQRLRAHPEITTVILAARWSTYLEGEVFNNREGGIEAGSAMTVDALGGSRAQEGWDAARKERVGAAYRDGVQALLGMGKRVVLVYPIPEVGWDVPQWLALREMRGQPLGEDLSTSRAVYDARNHRVERAFDALASSSDRLITVRPVDTFCARRPGRCMVQLDGTPLYYDSNHLNVFGADMLLVDIADRLGWRR